VIGLSQPECPTHISKIPWRNREDVTLESKIYEFVGQHPRIVRFFGQDHHDGTIVLEYMYRGTRREFLRQYGSGIKLL
jgi:serine/threonine protein kinase